MTQHASLSCSRCGNAIPSPATPGTRFVTCAACGTGLRVEVFPAFFRGLRPGMKGEALHEESEASCYYHEQKRAVVHCDGCGRFLCSMCEVRVGNRVLCPVCIEKGRSSSGMEVLETERTLYDGLALTLAIVPLALLYPCFLFTVVTAPLAIYYAVRSWKMPGSILPRTRYRAILALVLAVLQMAAWAAFLAALID